MIGETLQQTQPSPQKEPLLLDAVVMGVGPGIREFLKHPLPLGVKYGCSYLPSLIKLDVYCIGDAVHEFDLPTDDTEIVCSYPIDRQGYTEFGTLPHGGSSGGMAISMACARHKIIGLAGFDGQFAEDDDDAIPFISKTTRLLQFWLNRGRRIISLMPKSPFDNMIETNVDVAR